MTTWRGAEVVVTVLASCVFFGGCPRPDAGAPGISVSEVEVPEGVPAVRGIRIGGIPRPVDAGFDSGALYILGGEPRAILFRVPLEGTIDRVESLPVSPSSELPLALEIAAGRAYVSGEWPRRIRVFDLAGWDASERLGPATPCTSWETTTAAW